MDTNVAPIHGVTLWKRLAGWLEKPIEPRWRAWLTCLGLAVITTLSVDYGGYLAIRAISWFTLEKILYLSSWSISPGLADVYILFPVSFSVLWYHPIALKLGVRRTLTWLALAILGCAVHCGVVGITDPTAAEIAQSFHAPLVFAERSLRISPKFPAIWSEWPNPWEPAIYAACLALPGLALIGRRTRPWMSIVAGATTSALMSLVIAVEIPSLTLIHTAIYAAILIYGTSPISQPTTGLRKNTD